jgi:hypothetical protein
MPRRRIVGVDVQLHAFLTSAQDGGGWSTSRPGRYTPGEKSPRCPRSRYLNAKSMKHEKIRKMKERKQKKKHEERKDKTKHDEKR